jgi:hypothetical protein
MAYFLGRDIKVAMTLEADSRVLAFGTNNVTTAASATADAEGNATGMVGRQAQGSSDSDAVANVFALQTTGHNTNPVSDLTGVDITLGTVDEDIAYMGQKTALKAEIKRETTLVLTMKKKDQFWSDLFTSFRYGVIDNTETASYTGSEGDAIDGLSQPTAKFGYRAHLALNDDASGQEEVISIPNMTFSEYSTTLNADGVTEETCTFISHVTPYITAEPVATVTPTDSSTHAL